MLNKLHLPPVLSVAVLGLSAALCTGCAGLGTPADQPVPLAQMTPGHDQIIAWVPRTEAQTAGVALAVAHVALTEAKRATERELCGGTWVFSGRIRQNAAPEPRVAPERLGGFRGWHLRLGWDPQLADCGVDAQAYALALSRHLPPWMMTQSAQPLALFHQGNLIGDGGSLYASAASQ